jgi:CRP-like cAMP-binding protein
MTRTPFVDKRKLLASISIFDGLTPAQMELLLGITTTRRLQAKEVLFRKGDPGNQLFGVMRGRLRVSATGGDAKEVVFGFLDPGEVFGEIALLDSNPRSATVEAIEPAELLALHHRDLLPFLEQHPKVAINLARLLAERLRGVSERMEDTVFLTIPARLAKKLLGLVHAYGRETAEGTRINLRLSQQELGELVGATRESVNKQLRTWVDQGIVTVDQGYITILNEEELESLARFVIF